MKAELPYPKHPERFDVRPQVQDGVIGRLSGTEWLMQLCHIMVSAGKEMAMTPALGTMKSPGECTAVTAGFLFGMT